VDVEFLITAHIRWKLSMRTAALMKQKVDVAEITRDDLCEVGKWLYGAAQISRRSSPVYRRVVNEHALFHMEAGKVARLINAGQYDDAAAALDANSAYAKASQTAIAAINELRAET
jgi:methyl-accepting chemotaxis protein